MASVENLKRQRKSIKAKITRVKTFLDSLVVPASVTELKVKDAYLNETWIEFKINHESILEHLPDEEADAEDLEFVTYESTYMATIVRIRELIDGVPVSTPTGSTPSVPGSGSSSSNQADGTGNAVPAVKLPRMELPVFSGNQLDWQSFHDLFTSIVHNNNKISNSQKLHYLKNSLKDEAEVLLKSMDVTDANYDIAWDRLKERFENKRQITHCHVKSLLTLPTMTNECSIQLRKLVDCTNQHIQALKNLGLGTDYWDPIVVVLIVERLDTDSRRLWELASPGKTFPPLDELIIFLDQRCRALEATNFKKPKQTPKLSYSQQQSSKPHVKSYFSSDGKQGCPLCKSPHQIYHCNQFTKLDLNAKVEVIKRNRLCFNCLRSGHSSRECKSESSCRTCKQKPHTLLHVDRLAQSSSVPSVDNPQSVNLTNRSIKDGNQVLLKTALVNVEDSCGNMQLCRAFLDDGSQSSLITDACVRRLGLSKSKSNTIIGGVGNSSIIPCGKVKLILHSTTSYFSITTHATVLKQLTGHLPQTPINISDWTYLDSLALADSSFNEPAPIDILLGANVYEQVMIDGKIQGQHGMPIARRSHLGWVLSGEISNHYANIASVHIATTNISDQLRKFWELEELTKKKYLTDEEKQCELSFQSTVTRDSSGRYTVSIPFKQNNQKLGLSKSSCMNRLQSVERRLNKYPQYKAQYESFMDEYLKLGHMERIPDAETSEIPGKTNYLPHHFVLKESSSTTSLRVVFDASAKTTTGISLNDMMQIGPKLQPDIHTTLLRFRLPVYVFTADVAKMYRQIRVTPEDANLQRILWRRNPTLPVEEYRLTTVTYGTASAPYLAVKSLQQLAKDDGNMYPLAQRVTLSSFYVDDVMAGKNNLSEALVVQAELISMLRGGGFHLRKWSANHPALLEAIHPDDRETSLPLCIDSEDSIKALGLHWNPANDYLFFKVNMNTMQNDITKRSILSETARLFDPLGWLAPVIVTAKIILQRLWLAGVTWDSKVPEDIESRWIKFKEQLPMLEELRIVRHVGGILGSSYQLHGFCDASETAYSAVVYLRAESSNISTHLLTSKTRVAPVKQVTLPRLELCGATLLAKLLDQVRQTIDLDIQSIHAWTDSTVTLSWIAQHPCKWVTFVANRVSEIQFLLDPSIWRHVPSPDNPADCASRGMMPDEIQDFSLWWNGPDWLSQEETEWPATLHLKQTTSLDERKSKVLTATMSEDYSFAEHIINKYSSFPKLVRVMAWILRYVQNLRTPQEGRNIGNLTTLELQHSIQSLVKHIQQQEFTDTIRCLKNGKPLPNSLSSLHPFVDSSGVLRVGGRLRNSIIPLDHKNPMILPKRHFLTTLIVQHEHIAHLHAGSQLLLATINQKYWIVGGKSLIREIIRKCITCAKLKATTKTQLMADLPPFRVQASRPFLRTGVDYGGPLQLKSIKGRGGKICKGYIAYFVCLSTKATHIELVSDLTSDAFLATIRRFTSRRGKPTDIHSDNGTNFVGANSELRKLRMLLQSKQFQDDLTCKLADDGTNWHFIPPNAPHFGGLWEAGIKSTKSHLIRVIGEQILTFEEMYTLLTQIEACLNSRPLCQISTDPNDLQALTPGHFLIGEPLTSIPDPDLTQLKINRLSRWQLIQQLHQHFWKRWHLEYLSSLQQRRKWKSAEPNINIGDLAIIKDDNTPPLEVAFGTCGPSTSWN